MSRRALLRFALLRAVLVSAFLAGCAATPSDSASGPARTSTASLSAAPTIASVTPSASAAVAAPQRVTYHGADQALASPPPGIPVPTVRLFATGIQANEPSVAILPDKSFAYQGWDRPVASDATWHVFVGDPSHGAWRDISPTPIRPTHDPYLTVDPRSGRIFSANLLLPGELDPDRFCIVLSFTDDRGSTWSGPDPVCDADADRPRVITSIPVTSTPTEYPSIVSLCYFHSMADGQSCQRSIDGGRTFRPSSDLAPDGCDSGISGALFGHLATDKAGALYLARMSCRRPVIAISRDEGVTWKQQAIGPPGWDGYGEMAVGVDADGVVYGLWISGDRLPYLASSTDGGKTWSEPVGVAAPGVTEADLPVLEAGAGGRLALGMLVSTDAPAGIKSSLAVECIAAPCRDARGYENVTWHADLTITTNALDPAPLFVSAILNDPAQPVVRGTCGPGRCKANGDFIDLVIDEAGGPWLAFVACPGGQCPQRTLRPGWGSAPGMLGTIDGVRLR